MKRKRYSEEKIISILKEHEAGASAANHGRRSRPSNAHCSLATVPGTPC